MMEIKIVELAQDRDECLKKGEAYLYPSVGLNRLKVMIIITYCYFLLLLHFSNDFLSYSSILVHFNLSISLRQALVAVSREDRGTKVHNRQREMRAKHQSSLPPKRGTGVKI